MDLMNALDIAQAVSVTALIMIALIAVDRLIALTRAVRNNDQKEEEDEAGMRDVQESDDPSARDR